MMVNTFFATYPIYDNTASSFAMFGVAILSVLVFCIGALTILQSISNVVEMFDTKSKSSKKKPTTMISIGLVAATCITLFPVLLHVGTTMDNAQKKAESNARDSLVESYENAGYSVKKKDNRRGSINGLDYKIVLFSRDGSKVSQYKLPIANDLSDSYRLVLNAPSTKANNLQPEQVKPTPKFESMVKKKQEIEKTEKEEKQKKEQAKKEAEQRAKKDKYGDNFFFKDGEEE